MYPLKRKKREEGAVEETKTGKTKEIGNLASAELVFSFNPIPLVIAGIPEDLLPLCGPEVQSHYNSQAPKHGLHFSQKAVADQTEKYLTNSK